MLAYWLLLGITQWKHRKTWCWCRWNFNFCRGCFLQILHDLHHTTFRSSCWNITPRFLRLTVYLTYTDSNSWTRIITLLWYVALWRPVLAFVDLLRTSMFVSAGSPGDDTFANGTLLTLPSPVTRNVHLLAKLRITRGLVVNARLRERSWILCVEAVAAPNARGTRAGQLNLGYRSGQSFRRYPYWLKWFKFPLVEYCQPVGSRKLKKQRHTWMN